MDTTQTEIWTELTRDFKEGLRRWWQYNVIMAPGLFATGRVGIWWFGGHPSEPPMRDSLFPLFMVYLLLLMPVTRFIITRITYSAPHSVPWPSRVKCIDLYPISSPAARFRILTADYFMQVGASLLASMFVILVFILTMGAREDLWPIPAHVALLAAFCFPCHWIAGRGSLLWAVFVLMVVAPLAFLGLHVVYNAIMSIPYAWTLAFLFGMIAPYLLTIMFYARPASTDQWKPAKT